jgi:hypothetical protein
MRVRADDYGDPASFLASIRVSLVPYAQARTLGPFDQQSKMGGLTSCGAMRVCNSDREASIFPRYLVTNSSLTQQTKSVILA